MRREGCDVTATTATTLDPPVDPTEVNVVLPQRSVILAADGSTLATFWYHSGAIPADDPPVFATRWPWCNPARARCSR